MALSLSPSADGLTVELKNGATILMTLSNTGVDAGTVLASGADAQGLSNLKKLITPNTLNLAYKGANQSLASNGYQKFPGGLILQWGTDNFSATALKAVTYPIIFPTAVLNISITDNADAAANSSNKSVDSGTFTTSGFSARAPASETGIFFWTAIGY